MPLVDRKRWHEIEPLLDEALELTPEEQSIWLATLRTTSPDLAEELSRLLAGEVQAEARGFLAHKLSLPAADSLVGLQLGGYTLERPLGEGGMGWVWLARRSDGQFDGRAAIKLLNFALLSPLGQARIRREASALARLMHPNIARLLDAGATSGGQPYLVLDYVEGEPIDVFARRHQLSVAERIRLVLQILDAVGHAHANLIVHRDIKPSNILVTASGDAKLLDFGIAKLLAGNPQADQTALTADGNRALTPEFAAPEQLRGETITTATDIYGVGVLLYLLLGERRPFDLAGKSGVEMQRIICETEPPPLSVARDLAAIVQKAMHKEPARRYPSAAAFADDLQNFLHGRPVLAQPDTLMYRTGKFIRRHRGGVAAAAAVPLLLTAGVARERTLRTNAELETRKAKVVEEFLIGVFNVADPFAPPDVRSADVSARTLLDRGATRIDSVLADHPELRAELHGVLGNVYSNLALFDQAVPLLRRSLEQRRARYGERHPEVAEALDQLGVVLTQQDKLDEAEPLLREALAQRQQLLGSHDTITALTMEHLANLLRHQDEYEEAERLLTASLTAWQLNAGATHPGIAYRMNSLALLYFVKGEYEKAEPLYRQALQIHRRQLGENHPSTAQVLQNLAQTRQMQGETDEAETLFRQSLAAKRAALGNAHPSVTISLNNLGNMISSNPAKLAEAEALIREALALDRQMFGEKHDYVAASLQNLGTVMYRSGKFEEAKLAYEQALQINREIFGEHHTRVALHYSGIGSVEYFSGNARAAIAPLRRSLALYRDAVGEQHMNYNVLAFNLARALRDTGQLPEAEALLRGVVARMDTTSKPGRAHLIAAQSALGVTLVMQGRAPQARPLLEQTMRMAAREFPPADARLADPYWALGTCYAAVGERAAAVRELSAAYRIMEKVPLRRVQKEEVRAALRRLGHIVG